MLNLGWQLTPAIPALQRQGLEECEKNSLDHRDLSQRNNNISTGGRGEGGGSGTEGLALKAQDSS